MLNIYDTFTVSAFWYNALDEKWSDPDLFFDDRVATQSQPKPRWSAFAQVEAKF